MSAKRTKPPAVSLQLSLTAKQREALIQATRLKRSIKTRLEQAPPGTQPIAFSPPELIELGNETYAALSFAPAPQKRSLDAVLDRLNALLEAVEEQALQAKRQMNPPSGDVYQLKVTLKNTKPAVWRRIQVPDGTLGELHAILQVVMGWQESHLHQFVVHGDYYGVPFDDGFDMGPETRDEEDLLISQIAGNAKKTKFVYEYDFGDGWLHEIVVEKMIQPAANVDYPRCVGGARACPPEDCGGPWGYADFLEAIGDPDHEEHERLTEWIGGDFDPEAFDPDAVNKQLGAS